MKKNIIKEKIVTWSECINKKIMAWINKHLMAIWIIFMIISLGILICSIYIENMYLSLFLPFGAGILIFIPITIGNKLVEIKKRDRWKRDTEKKIYKEEKAKIIKGMENEQAEIFKRKKDVETEENNLNKRKELNDQEKKLVNILTDNGRYTVFKAEELYNEKEELLSFFLNRFAATGRMADNAKEIVRIAMLYKCADLFYPDLYRFNSAYKLAVDSIDKEKRESIITYLEKGNKEKAIEACDKLTGLDKIKKKINDSSTASTEDDIILNLEHLEKLPKLELVTGKKKDEGLEIGN